MPKSIKKTAETEVPMMPLTVPKFSNFELMAEAVVATTMEVMITILPLQLAFQLWHCRNQRENMQNSEADGNVPTTVAPTLNDLGRRMCRLRQDAVPRR